MDKIFITIAIAFLMLAMVGFWMRDVFGIIFGILALCGAMLNIFFAYEDD